MSERNAADAYAGPGKSFPLYKDGRHLKAAWNLAGHADNPAAVRAKIRAFARRYNLEHLLPDTAKEEQDDQEPKRVLSKARQEAVAALFHLAWQHESAEGDNEQKHHLAHFAYEHGLTHLLPPDAHSTLHEAGLPHRHDGLPPEHAHEVVKAYNPIGKNWVISKAWGDDTQAFVEGWLSTPHEDLEHDIIEPEAFLPSIDSYFARRAPVSYIHNGKTLPGGHLQKAAIVRDGRTLKEAVHPTDPADFEHFPGSGTGVYVRAVLNDPAVASAVRKGNVGGFSFIGNGARFTPRTPKGRHYTEINPWIESTVAPYPINANAVITVAKAYGLEPDTHEESMTEETLMKALRAILKEEEEPVTKASAEFPTPAPAFDFDRLEKLLLAQRDDTLRAVEEKVTKAVELVREQGAGSKATVREVLPQDNPLYGLVQKAREGKAWSENEERLVKAVTFEALTRGMTGDPYGDDEIKFL